MLVKFVPRLIPLLTVLVLVLASVTPLGFGEIVSFALPVLPFAAVHFWMFSEGRAIPVSAVFVVGIIVDVLTYGPLGYWSLLYLTGLAVTALVDALFEPEQWYSRWVAFVGANASVCVCAWGIATVYFGRAVDHWPMVMTAVMLGVCYPVLAVILGALDRWSMPSRQLNLERRV